MKDYLQELVSRSLTVTAAGLAAREYLQARTLEALQRAGAFSAWTFLGGTALRFLYRLPRFSEDLDFSLAAAEFPTNTARTEFSWFLEKIEKTFRAETYKIEIRDRPQAVVQSAFINFPGLPYELGLSPHLSQKLSIKIELDTNPPPHAITETSIVRRHTLLNLLHYDKASLFAGKLHALIHRPYLKGRDVYDLAWYLSDPNWPEPNLAFLQAALNQTGEILAAERISDWRSLVADRIAAMDWGRVAADVRPFLEQADDLSILTQDNLLKLLV